MYKPGCACCCTTVPMTESPPVQGPSVRGLKKKQSGTRRGVSTFSVPADSDSAALIAEAASAGAVASISFEPPGLDEVFLQIVAP